MQQEAKLFKLRADTMSVPHQWGCGGCVLGTGIFLLILIAAAMPRFLLEYDGESCENLIESQKAGTFCNRINFNSPLVFQTYIMDIDTYSQALYVKATPMKAYYSEPALVKTNLTYDLMIDEVRDDLLVTNTFKSINNSTALVSCDFQNTNDKTCSGFMLFALPQIDPGNYRVSVLVSDIMEKGKVISSLTLEAFVLNPRYYAVFLGVRYSFFALSLTTAIFYLINYSKVPRALRVFEQHAIVLMLMFLALFNDPLAYLNVVKPSRFSVFVSIFCLVMFVTYILFFWLVLFEVVMNNEAGGKLSTLLYAYLTKVFGIFFTAALCIAGYLFLEDPTFSSASKSAAYNGTFAIAAIFIGFALIYLGLNSFFIIKMWKQLIQRNKLLFIYSAGFVISMVGLLWGSAFNYYSNTGPNLLLAAVICNIYVFLLVYIMLPIPKSSDEVIRFFRNTEINQEINREYGRLPAVQEQELLIYQQEERLDRPPRKLIGVDDKAHNHGQSQEDNNDYTLDDDDSIKKTPMGTSLQNRPAMSPQEPLSGSQVKQKDGDSFTFN